MRQSSALWLDASLPLSRLAPRFAAMLGVLAGLREIGISTFDHWILIPMPELLLQTNVAWDLVIFGFSRALRSILIVRGLYHDSTSYDDRGLVL